MFTESEPLSPVPQSSHPVGNKAGFFPPPPSLPGTFAPPPSLRQPWFLTPPGPRKGKQEEKGAGEFSIYMGITVSEPRNIPR